MIAQTKGTNISNPTISRTAREQLNITKLTDMYTTVTFKFKTNYKNINSD